MTDKACAFCVKRHQLDAFLHLAARLECRAAPPVQDVGLHARFPVVKPDDYCHDRFALDVAAKREFDQAAAHAAELDRKSAETQARAAESAAQLNLEPGSPAVDAPAVDQRAAGDEPAVMGVSDAPEPVEPTRRARRARANDAPELPL